MHRIVTDKCMCRVATGVGAKCLQVSVRGKYFQLNVGGVPSGKSRHKVPRVGRMHMQVRVRQKIQIYKYKVKVPSDKCN